MRVDFDAQWHELTEDVLTGMKEWRLQHPKPPLARCGTPLVSDGRKERHLVTQHNQEVMLERSYGVCPTRGTGFFPPRR
jgi:hypothetical protein